MHRWLGTSENFYSTTFVNKGKRKRRHSYALAPSYLIAVKLALLRALRRYLLFMLFHSPTQFFHLPEVLLLLPPQFV